MNWFDHIGLRNKFLINFAATGGILILAIVFCLLQIDSVGKASSDISKKWLPSVQAAGEISQLRLRYRVRSLEYLLPGDAEAKTKLEKSLNDLNEEVVAAFDKYEKMVFNEQERQNLATAKQAATDYRNAVLEAIALDKAGQSEEAQTLRKTKWVQLANKLRDQTDLLVKFNRDGADRASLHVESTITSATKWSSLALAVGVVIALCLGYLISRRIQSRLNELVLAAGKIAQGDLRAAPPHSSRDEIGKLVDSVSSMQISLRGALGETLKSAGNISKATTDLNDTAQRINRASEVQSAAATAISANVEELVVSINHISDNTQDAAKIAHNSDEQAEAGHAALTELIQQIGQVADVVRLASSQMNQLKGDSEKISRIIAVIREIADQTNLLALNAAIEAARAGETGRGFAVVADEVRKLAERTAHSTGEISQMVGAIQLSTTQVVTGVSEGVNLVDNSVTLAKQAGDAIATMRSLSQQVTQIIQELNTTMREQSAASNDVAVKIEQISNQAEETSQIANETLLAAHSMHATADSMQNVVSRFQI